MTQLQVVLNDAVRERHLRLKLPDDVPLEQLVPALARKMGLPEGEYVLRVEGQAAPLVAEESLARSGVAEGSTLRFESVVAEAVPTKLPPAHTEPPTPKVSGMNVLEESKLPVGLHWMERVNWKVALLCILGSTLGSSLGWIPHCGIWDQYSVFLLWSIWGGLWSAILMPLLKPRQALSLLALGALGLGTISVLPDVLDAISNYSLTEVTLLVMELMLWPMIGGIWGFALAKVFKLSKKQQNFMIIIGISIMSLHTIAFVAHDFYYYSYVYYYTIIFGICDAFSSDTFSIGYMLYGLGVGVLFGVPLGYFYKQSQK